MKKKLFNFNFSLLGALLIFIGLYMYSQIQLHTPLIEYNFDIQTDDFYIRNLNFVAGQNDTYVSGYHLESKDSSKIIDGFAFGITVNGKYVLSSSQGGDPFTLPDAHEGIMNYYESGSLLTKTSLKPSDNLKIQLQYKVDGQRKEVIGEVELAELKKPLTVVSNKRYILNAE